MANTQLVRLSKVHTSIHVLPPDILGEIFMFTVSSLVIIHASNLVQGCLQCFYVKCVGTGGPLYCLSPRYGPLFQEEIVCIHKSTYHYIKCG